MEDEDTAASRFLRSVDGETVDTPDDDIEETLAVGASVAVGKSSAARPPSTLSVDLLGSQQSMATPSTSVFDSWMILNRKTLPSMPWNSGILKDPFAFPLKRPRLSPPVFGMQAAIAASPAGSSGSGATTGPPTMSVDFSKRRLRIARLIQTEDHARWEALRKVKVLVLLNPTSSELGTTLVANAALLKDDKQMGSSILDTFSAKATSTLVKRAGSLWRFARFCSTRGVLDPLNPHESTVYEYMQFLKVHGSPTSAHDFLQAWRFIYHTVGLKCGPIETVLSTRICGAADGMFSAKRKLVQAKPLTTRMVLALERIVLIGPYLHWRVIAGHFLLCLGSCSRFADSIRLDSITFDEWGGLTLIEASETQYKTATTRERKSRLLPILCLGRFLAAESWGPVWMRLRAEAGFGTDPSLCAFSEITSTWLTRSMSTGEAALFLKEFLLGSGFDAAELEGVSTHSLKSTILSYVAKGNYLPLPDRRILGHHLEPGDNSAVTYSRDELSRLMVKVEVMLQDIRNSKFKPDDSRVRRIAEQTAEVIEEVQVSESEPDSDDCSVADLDRSDMGLEPERTAFDDLTIDNACNSLVHIHSGVLHVLNVGGATFVCGRKRTKNYCELERTSVPTDIPVCIQCAKSLP